MGYCVLCIWAARRYASESRLPAAEIAALPPVSILKPLKGTDPEMYESFRSHCVQEFPTYEILFGVRDANDPAPPLGETLRQEFRPQSIPLVLCERNSAANGKISSL